MATDKPKLSEASGLGLFSVNKGGLVVLMALDPE
jgi:hypothetical protein